MTLAGLLRQDATPGLVAIGLIAGLCIAILQLGITIRKRRAALSWIKGIVTQTTNEEDFSLRISEFDQAVTSGRRSGPRASVARSTSLSVALAREAHLSVFTKVYGTTDSRCNLWPQNRWALRSPMRSAVASARGFQVSWRGYRRSMRKRICPVWSS